MYNVSESFVAAMKTRPYIARLTLDGTDVIQGDAIQNIVFRGGTNGEADAFTLGGTVASSAEISLDKAQAPSVAHGRQIKVELGMELSTGTEWIPMGVYYVTEPLADDDRLTVTACDALAAKFDREFEPVEGFDFTAEGGVSSTAFLVALCGRRGVQVDVSGLDPIALNGAPDGFTERQIIGFIAVLYGGFAWVDRTGVLKVRSFSKTDVKVTADDYYDSGMEKADYTFSAQWIKCYNEISDLTMVLGDVSAQQGIYLESIWMNSAILQGLWEKLQGFSYVPVTELSFFGNPLIDPGDIITMEDLSGVSVDVPVMRISHEYDGGVITRVTANGQAETSSPSGPLGQQLRRVEVKAKTYSGIALEDAKKYAKGLDDALDQLEVLKRLTAENVDDAIYMTNDGRLAFKATAILTGVLDAALVTVKNLVADVIAAGVLQSKDGGVYIDLDNGVGNLARGVAVTLSTWDDDMAGFTKDIDEVIDSFLVEQLEKMQSNTIRDFAAKLYSNQQYPDAAKLAVFKFTKTSGQPAASISFEWSDGTRSHKTASGWENAAGVSWAINPMEWL